MSARDLYPELAHIADGRGVEILEDAEVQATNALADIDALIARRDVLIRRSGAKVKELMEYDEAHAALIAEIDNLRRWKAEAVQVLTDWQQCYDTLAEAGHPAPLGMSMARHVAGYLKVTA